MLLCAGLGTRLRPLTNERPKPLVPLLGRPIAAYALDALRAVGVRSIVANTHHLGEQVQPTLTPFTDRLSMSLETLHEPVLLGTGGGIRNALPRLGQEPFVVFNGDVLAAPDIAQALALHKATSAQMTMILREDPKADALGSIEVDQDGRVVRILNEGPPSQSPTRKCMFTGVYIVSPDVRDDLPENGCIVRHSLRRWLARGDRVSAIIDDGPWFDLGTIASYAEVTFGLLDGTIAFPSVKTQANHSRIGAVRAAPSVRIGERCDLGDGVELSGEGELSRVIAWDGAKLTAPARDVIVTTGGARVAIG
ncbi:MAG: nucleotidyltransferase family protein [Polyangiales bacterium]